MKTVLIYVLSSAVSPYPILTDAAMATWASVPVEGTETLFYTSMEPRQLPNLIQFDVSEGYNEMGRKNLLAYEWALKNKQWDYMARVNASCYVSKRLLIKHVQDLPDSGLFLGVGVSQGGECVFLWGGMQYIFSRDVIQSFVDNKHKWNHGVMEDIATSQLAKDLEIKWNMAGRGCSIDRSGGRWLSISYGTPGFEFDNFSEFKEKNVNHFIRVKQDGDRTGDVRIMHELHKLGV